MVFGMNDRELFAKNVPRSNKLLFYGRTDNETEKNSESFQKYHLKKTAITCLKDDGFNTQVSMTIMPILSVLFRAVF